MTRYIGYPTIVQENLYQLMDDGVVMSEIVPDSPTPIPIPPCCVMGATTDVGYLTQPLRDRFELNLRMEDYSLEGIVEIGWKKAKEDWPGFQFSDEVLKKLSIPARFNPRLLRGLIARCTEVAQSWGLTEITSEVVGEMYRIMGIEKNGIRTEDRRYMECLSKGPTGLAVLSQNTDTDKRTLEHVIEPFLSRQGLIQRSNRGRHLTEKGRELLMSQWGFKIG